MIIEFGNTRCGVLALLENTGCNLQIIDLGSNDIRDEGASILANGLANKTKMKELYLDGNPIFQGTGDEFTRILCNKSNINSILLQPYASHVSVTTSYAPSKLDSFYN